MTRNGPTVNRYMLVPRPTEAEVPASPVRRRYSLARVGASARSALGEDRHERLERAAAPASGEASRPFRRA